MKTSDNLEKVANVLWSGFGFITGFSYYQKQDYLAAGVLFLIGILYAYRSVISLLKKTKNINDK